MDLTKYVLSRSDLLEDRRTTGPAESRRAGNDHGIGRTPALGRPDKRPYVALRARKRPSE